MTRKEAINYLEISMAIDDSRHHNEVLEFIIKALEQEPKIVPIAEIKFDDDMLHEIVEEAVKNIEIEPKWIPVSERLPETNDVYLVAINSWGCPQRAIDGFMSQTTRKWKVYGNKVIAWMPLPAPYKV